MATRRCCKKAASNSIRRIVCRIARRHRHRPSCAYATGSSAAASWRAAGTFPGGRAELTGLPPGALVWVRVRTVGLRGVLGAWSDLAEIRVV